MGIIIKSTWRSELVKARSRESAQAGVIRAAEHLRTRAVRQAPVDEGDLRRSASAVNLSGLGTIQAAVTFNRPYAVRQHEELGYRHPKGGKAKYLEDPMNSEAATMLKIISATIARGG